MFFPRPAVRAHQVRRRPTLDVGVRNHIVASPGAGLPHPGYYYEDGYNSLSGLTFLTTGIPETTTLVTDVPASSIGDTPTPTTVVRVSTSDVTIVAPKASASGIVLNSTLPTSINTSDIIASSSSPSPQPPSSPQPTVPTSSIPSQETAKPVYPGVADSSMAAMTSPTDSVLAGSVGGAKKSPGLSGGAVAAIVILVLLGTCAIAFFIFRNRRIRKRIARRVTWATGLAPNPNFDSLEKGASQLHPISSSSPTGAAGQSPTNQGNAGGEGQAPFRNIPRKAPLPYSPVTPTPPPQSHNNPPPVAIPNTHQATTPTLTSITRQDVPMLVRVTFVPQLPDELAITPGETLYIRMEFDDGWALCVNTRGNQGMVPLECLEGGGDDGLAGPSRVRDWRKSRRASSLRTVATWT